MALSSCAQVLNDAGSTFIHERRPGSDHVARVDVLEPKAGFFDELSDRPIQMTATSDPFPQEA